MSKANERRQSMSSVRTSGPVLGGVLVLLAAWFGWSSYTQWRQDAVAQELEQARDRAVQDISRAMAQQASQLDAVLKQPQVIAALANGDALAAASSIRERFKGAEDVQVLSGDLAAAYDNPKDFGYARLSLLESALVAERAQVHVVRDAKQVRLGVAAAVRLGAQPAVAYARLPLLRLTGPLDAIAVPGSAYLALRQGSYNVAQQGDAVLADAAETLARPLGNSGLRVAAAVPQRDDGPLGLGAVGCAIVAALLLVIAVLLVLASRGRVALPRRRVAGEPTADEPTFSQSLQHDASLASQARALEADVPPAPPALVPAVQVATEMFRAYDIRGVVGKDLNPGVAALIGQAIGSVMQAQGLREVVVGRDGRLSGPELANGLIDGLRRAGCQVIDIGLAPTPVVYFGAYELRAGSCVAVTGSHNPPDYNGFKIVIGGETLSGAAIAELHQRINEGRLHTAATPGDLEQRDISDAYIQRIADDVQLDRPIKVVVDAGNGVAGDIAPRLLEAIGAEVIPLYCEIDGTFPNHHPDPSEPHNLDDLVKMVQRFDADIGVAFDGDADRLGVVTKQGAMVFPDRLLMLFAADVLQRNPGALVIYDVKCTGKLSDHVLRNGGSPLMWKTGHSLIKAKMRETDAELAGEMSGHFFFKERWYGFDDGIYAAARLLEILAQREETPSEVLDALPESVSTPEIKVPVDGDAHALVARIVERAQAGEESPFESARLSTIDGLRADFADGWGLVRASNTTPILVLRFEADTEDALQRIRGLFRSQLQALLPDHPLEF
ncbi:phosphomannomutase/phosphoglucomutase [Xanthomonas arboricola]|uniref:phosphomannomutase/phosphoglucomutase n=1 Tax=Xanthomonas arboricola TaxID=56448 RepID=UPI00030C580C|nr:phosphomannomutase/phosphoglucomutase [Xanthomonas arboricola]MDN0222407.1 phosphomannomutase/phosphoglucomutase [Xanthomonas arboricola pv. juglandis]MDN0243396.1 phosphomannomutase/phosphoglucomutase [Xanthomonas arboricola pv. juglandis]MDN0256002.1 phosphomannomutase/phosphoglucomutase [Xanthomonas arboricola pv. juglandis]MDN0260034.1 phosphomannomutase/phosphoglucomutase [Xanthomonas arboricola pv. juglandis]MDN0264093.1 phosphomannomutase/phosphoglucomutase [Xanthomonas arboricola pv